MRGFAESGKQAPLRRCGSRVGSGKRQELANGGENALANQGMGMRMEVGAALRPLPSAWGNALPQKSTNRRPIRIEFAPGE